MKRKLLIFQIAPFFVPLCLWAFVPSFSLAQSPSVQATVDTGRTTLERPIRLSVTIAGDDGTVDTSVIKDFKVMSQSSGSSIQIINGQVNRERTYTYTLLPLKEGRLTIPALSVTVDGKTAVTNPIVVQVSKGAAASDDAVDIQVYGTVNIHQPYIGQQIIYTFRLLYGVQLANTDYEPPSFEGFSATQIGNQTTRQRVLNGQRLQEVTIAYLLVPLKAGPLTIAPAQLQCDLVYSRRRSSRSMFDSFFDDSYFGNSQLVPKVLRTDPVTIEVLPLPEWSGPELFSGLVGQFGMAAEMETNEVAVGESVTLSVILKGKGNLQDADALRFQVPDAFKQYTDQPEVDVQLGPDGYAGKKVFRTALVPVEAGDYTLDVTPMVYFNPDDGAYRRLAVSPLHVTVHPSNEATETATVFSTLDPGDGTPSQRKQKVDFTGRDILSIKTGLDALLNRESMPTVWFLMVLAAPGIAFLVLFSIFTIVKKDDRPAAVMTRKSREALHAAGHAPGSDDTVLLFSNLYRALLYAVFARAGTLGESLTRNEVAALLAQNAVDAETSDGVSMLFGELESARFGKIALSNEEQKSLVSETRRMVKRLVR